MNRLFVIIFIFGSTKLVAFPSHTVAYKPLQDTMKLKITIKENIAKAVLYDNPTSRDFAMLLPLTLELSDYAQIEKVANLPEKLTQKDAPNGFDASVGDLTYYAPWGNMALFYKDLGYASGLISLGKITHGLEYFNTEAPVTITIELED